MSTPTKQGMLSLNQHLSEAQTNFHTDSTMTTNVAGDSNLSRPAAGTARRRQGRRQHNKQRGGGRLWQLPESSIQEYAKWIQEKHITDQSPAEKKFLWKYQRRMHLRQHKLPSEKIKDYVARLEQKEQRTSVEEQLIRSFYRRKAKRNKQQPQTQQQRGIPPPIFCRRNRDKKHQATSSVLSNIASLRESMNKLGLSSDKLRDVNMENLAPPSQSQPGNP